MNWKLLDCDVGGMTAYIPKSPCLGVGAASLLGAGVSALGGLFSSGLSSVASEKIARENREWQEKMWNKSNLYNSPVEQRKRLEAAGINPALAFASGNTGVASSTPNAPNAPMPDFSSIGAGFSAAAAQLVQGKQVDAQTDLMKSQAEAQRIENSTLHLRRLAEWQKLKSEAKKTDADTSWIDWQEKRDMAMFDAIQKKNYAEIQNLNSQTMLNNVQAVLGWDNNSREWQKLQPVIRQLEAAANASNSSALLSRRQADIIPRLSPHQLDLIANAYVDEKLKNASAEDIAGFRFSGTTVQEMKTMVKDYLKSLFAK